MRRTTERSGRGGRTGTSHPLPADLVDLVAERFRVLGDSTRLELLDRLREGEASVAELTETIGTTQQNVSKHLGVLLRAGIVSRRKRGSFTFYAIVDEGVFELGEVVCGSLSAQLESLRRALAAAT